jgi:amino-acid N-acetyltransferase
MAIQRLFVRSTQTMQWFEERGFTPCDISQTPPAFQAHYNYQRNSKVLFKTLQG